MTGLGCKGHLVLACDCVIHLGVGVKADFDPASNVSARFCNDFDPENLLLE